MGKLASTVTKRVEKRRKSRRNTADRREEIRWEKSSTKSKEGERRSGSGRRFEDKVWDKIQSKK
jgi:hypothetical protein